MKICSKCKENKVLKAFSNKKTAKDGKHSQCKICTRKLTKIHYEKNKKYYFEKRKRNQEELQKWYIEYKDKLHCTSCGEDRHWVLDFHHIDPTTKKGSVNVILHSKGKEAFLKEVKKCKILCSNCHRDFHHHNK